MSAAHESYCRTAGDLSLHHNETVALSEVLDRVLNKGAVVMGEVIVSVAGVDLLYLGLQLVLTSMQTAREKLSLQAGNAAAVPLVH